MDVDGSDAEVDDGVWAWWALSLRVDCEVEVDRPPPVVLEIAEGAEPEAEDSRRCGCCCWWW